MRASQFMGYRKGANLLSPNADAEGLFLRTGWDVRSNTEGRVSPMCGVAKRVQNRWTARLAVKSEQVVHRG